MESANFVRAQLANYTNADCSNQEVKNNRYHYHLKFEQRIGWDWLYRQVNKVSGELDVSVEPYELGGSGVEAFELEVREVERREGIDDNQHGLTDFEQ